MTALFTVTLAAQAFIPTAALSLRHVVQAATVAVADCILEDTTMRRLFWIAVVVTLAAVLFAYEASADCLTDCRGFCSEEYSSQMERRACNVGCGLGCR